MVIGTGGGKTVCFAHLIKRRGGKTLVVAHREELLEQAKRTIETVNPDLKVSIEQADRRAELDDDVVIASVATLGRASTGRIERFPEDHFNTLIVDEAHHASKSNQTYWSILERFDVGLRLGVTATPQRGDNTSLKDAFERIVYFMPMVELIKEGYLVPFVGHRIRTDTDISGVASRAGDYAVGELSRAVNITERNALIVSSYNDIAPTSKAVVFCVDVAHAEAVCEEFNNAEIPAAYVVGTTPRDERREILEKFHHGDIKILVNVGVAVEGFDEPSVDCIILARPTKSKVFLTQALGRGTRLFEGKDSCTVIDLCDATKGRSPVTLPTLLGLPPEFDLEGQNSMEVLEEYEKLEEEAPEEAARVQSLEDIKAAWDHIDLFTLPPVNEDLLEYTQLTWMEMGGGKYVLNVSPEERLIIKEDALGQYAVDLKYKGKEYRLGAKEGDANAGLCDSMEEVFQRTDAWIEKRHADKLGLLDATAQWRDEPPTEKQLKFFKKNKLPITTKLTKGQASRMIDKWIEQNPRPPRSAAQQYMIRQNQQKRW